MGLIKTILSREDCKYPTRIKASVSYLKKVHKSLKNLVQDIKKTIFDMQQLEISLSNYASKRSSSEKRKIKIKIRKKMDDLTKQLEDLDEAIAKFYKIDTLRKDYTNQEKRYLEELQKFWHSIDLDTLPPDKWSIIVKIVVDNNLKNARLLTG